MITEEEIKIANKIIDTGLVDEVYNSVELIADKKGELYPAYTKGKEQNYIGPDDSFKLYAYTRVNGVVTRVDQRLEGSCTKNYRISVPLRVVFFQDNREDNFDALAQRLMNSFIFLPDVTLTSFDSNPFRLAKQESPMGTFTFDETTFYLAVDIQLKIWISPNDCPENTCIVHPNPICKPKA